MLLLSPWQSTIRPEEGNGNAFEINSLLNDARVVAGLSNRHFFH